MYSTILFDFDGTLTSSLELWLQAFHYTFSQYGLNFTDDQIVQRCFYREFRDLTDEFGLPCAIEFGQLVREGLSIFFEKAKLFSGVKNVLVDCEMAKIKLAVVTSSPRNIVERALGDFQIDSFFHCTITADDIVNFKPHPESVLLALNKLNSKPEESLIIGDSQADMLAGRAAGVKRGLFFPDIHAQFYDFDQLMTTEPDFVFHNYDELSKYILL